MTEISVVQLEEHIEKGLPYTYELNELQILLEQLLGNKVNIAKIIATIRAENSLLLVAEKSGVHMGSGGLHDVPPKIVGTATLIIMTTPHGQVGYIHDVVADEKQRGQGIGTLLMQTIFSMAESQGLVELNLTTSREDAARLYMRLGFEEKATGFYAKKVAA